jgi:hypothetical protein
VGVADEVAVEHLAEECEVQDHIEAAVFYGRVVWFTIRGRRVAALTPVDIAERGIEVA